MTSLGGASQLAKLLPVLLSLFESIYICKGSTGICNNSSILHARSICIKLADKLEQMHQSLMWYCVNGFVDQNELHQPVLGCWWSQELLECRNLPSETKLTWSDNISCGLNVICLIACRVSINGNASDNILLVISGVPQGIILGSVLL